MVSSYFVLIGHSLLRTNVDDVSNLQVTLCQWKKQSLTPMRLEDETQSDL